MKIGDAARALGLSERHLYRIEDGTTPPKRSLLLAMSVVYRVSLGRLVKAAAGEEKP